LKCISDACECVHKAYIMLKYKWATIQEDYKDLVQLAILFKAPDAREFYLGAMINMVSACEAPQTILRFQCLGSCDPNLVAWISYYNYYMTWLSNPKIFLCPTFFSNGAERQHCEKTIWHELGRIFGRMSNNPVLDDTQFKDIWKWDDVVRSLCNIYNRSKLGDPGLFRPPGMFGPREGDRR
jgi:hypothetical protein